MFTCQSRTRTSLRPQSSPTSLSLVGSRIPSEGARVLCVVADNQSHNRYVCSRHTFARIAIFPKFWSNRSPRALASWPNKRSRRAITRRLPCVLWLHPLVRMLLIAVVYWQSIFPLTNYFLLGFQDSPCFGSIRSHQSPKHPVRATVASRRYRS